ncbi:hypothetical protein F2Q68_00030527 [Brassica cretica]|uniref:Uncharacterized protein n=1 Tax=Brassica cretica TaxID=69181 RepID=A0A8S9GEQ7_BRACR|nr:hypothetical protein F2Q68_00030527 [Brassica cretica]
MLAVFVYMSRDLRPAIGRKSQVVVRFDVARLIARPVAGSNLRLAAGLYSGITYGMKEARGGAHDWRNSAVAGALTGAAMAMTTSERTSHEQVVQSALTGAAISTAANLLSSVF